MSQDPYTAYRTIARLGALLLVLLGSLVLLGWLWNVGFLTTVLPGRITRLFAAENGSTLAFGLRNIHTWTSFTGVDPEQNYGVNGSEVTNDFNTSPPPTYITFRLNLRY